MAFIELNSAVSGCLELINLAHVAVILPDPENKGGSVVWMSDGRGYQVMERYEAIVDRIAGREYIGGRQ